MILKRPVGYSQIVAMFGDPSTYRLRDGTLSPMWEDHHIVRVDLPKPMPYVGGGVVTRLAVHTIIAENVAALMVALAARDDLWSMLCPYGGGFEPRLKRGSSKVSLHTFGIALDFNPEEYPLGSDKRMPQEIINLFAGFGWMNGADFHRRHDPMHFQFAEGY